MGASNVKAVYAQWGDLTNNAFRLLAYMALVSMDADNPPRYWGGREDLAAALGREVPPENDDDPEVTRKRNVAFKAQRDATGVLSQRGAIKAIKNARGGQRQEWALNLRRSQVHENRAPEDEQDPAAQVHENCAPQAHENRADRCTKIVAEEHENRAPKEDQEPPGATTGVSQSAQELEAIGLLHDRYGLTDHESAQVIAEARRRARDPIRNLVPYLAGEMTTNGSLAAIVEAVQLGAKKAGGPDDDRTYEEAAVQPDQPTYQPPPYVPPVEPKPVSEIPSADPLAGLTNEELRDWLHVDRCKTLACDRCWHVRESGQHPMFPSTNMETVPPMQESA